jgi:hypothetical protein
MKNLDIISESDNTILTGALVFKRPTGWVAIMFAIGVLETLTYSVLRKSSTISMIHSINPNISEDKVMYISWILGGMLGAILTILPIILKIMVSEHNRLTGKKHFDFGYIVNFLIGFVIYVTMLNHDNSELTKSGLSAEILFYISKYILPLLLVVCIVALSFYCSTNMIELMNKSGVFKAMDNLVDNGITRLNTETIKKQQKSLADIISKI